MSSVLLHVTFLLAVIQVALSSAISLVYQYFGLLVALFYFFLQVKSIEILITLSGGSAH